jgi:hypothetical protein
MADASLWPIVLTGLFTLVGSLGGIGVGLVGTARRDAAQDRREARKRREEKFEELVAAVYEFDHWLTLSRQRVLKEVEGIPPETVSPFAKVQSIAAVYFPQFSEMVDELNIVSSRYVAWIYNPQEAALFGTAKPLQFEEVYRPYVQKFEALLDALKAFAHEEFQ